MSETVPFFVTGISAIRTKLLVSPSSPYQSETVVAPAPRTSSVPATVMSWCETEVTDAAPARAEPDLVANAAGSVAS